MKYIAAFLFLLLTACSSAADGAQRPTMEVDGKMYPVYEHITEVRPTRHSQPTDPKRALDEGRGGMVLVGALVGLKGEIRNVFVIRADAGIDIQEAAKKAVAKWRFPKKKEGDQAISYVVPVPISLSPRR